jgi:hypothetical protein
MAGSENLSQTSSLRTLNNILPKYIRQEESCVLRKHVLGAMLDARGRVSFNNSGEGIRWPVKIRLHEMQPNNGYSPRVFTPLAQHRQAGLKLDKGYQLTEAIYKGEMLSGRGAEALVNTAKNITANLLESGKEGLATQYYIDGNASGNEGFFDGLETMFGMAADPSTVHIDTGAERTGGNDADLFGWPDATYALLSTQLGDLGGAQRSGVWPNGQADPHYDPWTPIIQHYNSTALNGTAHTWADQCEESIALAFLQTRRNDNGNSQNEMVILDRDLYRQLANKKRSTERVNITSDLPLRSFGFADVIEVDNIQVTWDYACPANVGYGFNVENIELLLREDSLLKLEQDYDIDTQAQKYVMYVLGNLRFSSPRRFFKLMDVA